MAPVRGAARFDHDEAVAGSAVRFDHDDAAAGRPARFDHDEAVAPVDGAARSQ